MPRALVLRSVAPVIACDEVVVVRNAADAAEVAGIAQGMALDVVVSSCLTARGALFALAALGPQLRRDGIRVEVDSADDDVIVAVSAIAAHVGVVCVLRAQRFMNA